MTVFVTVLTMIVPLVGNESPIYDHLTVEENGNATKWTKIQTKCDKFN